MLVLFITTSSTPYKPKHVEVCNNLHWELEGGEGGGEGGRVGEGMVGINY